MSARVQSIKPPRRGGVYTSLNVFRRRRLMGISSAHYISFKYGSKLDRFSPRIRFRMKKKKIVLSQVRSTSSTNLEASPLDLVQNNRVQAVKTEDNKPSLNGLCPPTLCRPVPPMFPPIWSKTRQEVCESFDWFRSYQGGVYFRDDQVKGYLLGGFASKRDILCQEGKLIISHGGGKSENASSGKGQAKLVSAGDQSAGDKSVRALLQNYEKQIPLVLIIDSNYSQFPFDLRAKDISYAVLGLYTIVHTWEELEMAGGKAVVRFKFAFQWCNAQGEPWWLQGTKADHNHRVKRVFPPNDTPLPWVPTLKKEAQKRRVPVKVKEARLASFWKLNGQPPPDSLEYNSEFLQLLPSDQMAPTDIMDIQPKKPITHPHDGVTTLSSFLRGYHCEMCGRLSCRFKWQQWECANPDCRRTLPVFGKIQLAKDLDHLTSNSSMIGDHELKSFSEIKVSRTIFVPMGGGISWSYQRFDLPEEGGSIFHMKHPKTRMHEMNQIFEENKPAAESCNSDAGLFEVTEVGREIYHTLHSHSPFHVVQGELLTQYFSQNCGEPYHYVGGDANTVPWDQAPGAVLKAREMIHQKFHTDDEPGLGPTVAGLSLGAPAKMHFRKRGTGHRDTELTVLLRHGDILVMHGPKFQKTYEHTVIPENFRIAATARYIDPARHKYVRR
uniref:Alpha-ketoglutarate-dependent dioxygenase AlkB-like domain-containing protein n=1 Tax=Moniliophthora roreri TaxID=221103 RepID=A0A0W0F0A1_MONRR